MDAVEKDLESDVKVEPKIDFEENGDLLPETEIKIDISTVSKVAEAAKAAKKFKRKGHVPKSCRLAAMDLSKAHGILGFSGARWLNRSPFDSKAMLDKAHFNKTLEILKKKEAEAKESEEKIKEIEISAKRREMSHDDQIRTLHEAYQFLLKKNKWNGKQTTCMQAISPFMKSESDESVKNVTFEDGHETTGMLSQWCVF